MAINAVDFGDGVQLTYANGDDHISFWLNRVDAERLAFFLNVSLKELDAKYEDEQLRLSQEPTL